MQTNTLAKTNKIGLFCFDFEQTMISEDFDRVLADSNVSGTEAELKAVSSIEMRGDSKEWNSLFETLTKNGKKIAIIADRHFDLVTRYLKARFPTSVMQDVHVMQRLPSMSSDRNDDLTEAMRICEVQDKNQVVLIDGNLENIASAEHAGFRTILAPTDNMNDAPHIKSVYELAGISTPTNQKEEKEEEKKLEKNESGFKNYEAAKDAAAHAAMVIVSLRRNTYPNQIMLNSYEIKLTANLDRIEVGLNLIDFQNAVIKKFKETYSGHYNEKDILEMKHIIQDSYLSYFKKKLTASALNLNIENREFEELKENMDNLDALVHKKSLWPVNVDNIFGIKKTASWQKFLEEIRTDAWNKLENQLAEKKNDIQAQIDLLESAHKMAIFKDHKNNSIFFGAFGRTQHIKKIEDMLKELKKQPQKQQENKYDSKS